MAGPGHRLALADWGCHGYHGTRSTPRLWSSGEGAALGAQEQVGASVAEAWVLFQHVWHEALPGSKGWTNILRRGRMRQTLLPGYHGVGCSTIGSLTEGSSGGMGHPSVVQDNDWDKEGSCEQGAANAQELGVGTGPEGIWAGHRQQE